MTEELREKLNRLESILAEQQETIEAQQAAIEQQRERIDELDGETDSDDIFLLSNRRNALQAGGLLALLFGGIGTASADTQGQVGTDENPLDSLYTEELDGGVTGDTALTDLLGNGLDLSSGSLGVAPGGIKADEIAESVVTDAELADTSVNTPQIASGAVNSDKVTEDVRTVEVDGQPVTKVDTTGQLTAKVSGDTATLEVSLNSSFDVSINSVNYTEYDGTIEVNSVDYTVTNNGILADKQTIEVELRGYGTSNSEDIQLDAQESKTSTINFDVGGVVSTEVILRSEDDEASQTVGG